MKKSDKKQMAEKLLDAVIACLLRSGVQKESDARDIIATLAEKLTADYPPFTTGAMPLSGPELATVPA